MTIHSYNAIQPQALMQARSSSASHNINPQKSATQSAFLDYLFGPAASPTGLHSGGMGASNAVAKLKQSIDSRS